MPTRADAVDDETTDGPEKPVRVRRHRCGDAKSRPVRNRALYDTVNDCQPSNERRTPPTVSGGIRPRRCCDGERDNSVPSPKSRWELLGRGHRRFQFVNDGAVAGNSGQMENGRIGYRACDVRATVNCHRLFDEMSFGPVETWNISARLNIENGSFSRVRSLLWLMVSGGGSTRPLSSLFSVTIYSFAPY